MISLYRSFLILLWSHFKIIVGILIPFFKWNVLAMRLKIKYLELQYCNIGWSLKLYVAGLCCSRPLNQSILSDLVSNCWPQRIDLPRNVIAVMLKHYKCRPNRHHLKHLHLGNIVHISEFYYLLAVCWNGCSYQVQSSCYCLKIWWLFRPKFSHPEIELSPGSNET